MIVLGIFGGFAALCAGLIIAELRGKGRPRRRIDARAVDIERSSSSFGYSPKSGGVSEYFPPPDDGRPQK